MPNKQLRKIGIFLLEYFWCLVQLKLLWDVCSLCPKGNVFTVSPIIYKSDKWVGAVFTHCSDVRSVDCHDVMQTYVMFTVPNLHSSYALKANKLLRLIIYSLILLILHNWWAENYGSQMKLEDNINFFFMRVQSFPIWTFVKFLFYLLRTGMISHLMLYSFSISLQDAVSDIYLY